MMNGVRRGNSSLGTFRDDEMFKRRFIEMSALLITFGRWGGIVTLIVLLIALVKQLIALVSFLLVAIKIGIVLAFVAVLALIFIAMMRGRARRRRDLGDD